MTSEIAGSRPGRLVSREEFDRELLMTGRSELLWRLMAEAYGDEYPAEVQPWSDTTWWLLGRCVSGLRIGRGAVLGDLACGRGGPGLWLARATGASLLGVDWSEVAVAEASSRVEDFVPVDRVRFVVGLLDATGLGDQSLDGAVCIDALFFAPDRVAALCEVARVLRPGARFLFTADEREKVTQPADVLDWSDLVHAAGLEVVSKEPIPGLAERTQRIYGLWLAHLDELRLELGDEVANQLATEANTVGPTLGLRRALLVTARRSGEPG